MRRLLGTVLIALVGLAGPGLSVAAAESGADRATQAQGNATVRSLVVESSDQFLRSRVQLDFDVPVTQAQADQLRRSLVSPVSAVPADIMLCGSRISRGDANGYFDIAYQCGTRRTLPWGFQLSNAVQAIVVSNVTERGLEWWRNGAFAGQNAGHVAPKDYRFHGNMGPVYAGNHIDYQDYLTFRHNVGSGGTGSVTFAGGVDLRN